MWNHLVLCRLTAMLALQFGIAIDYSLAQDLSETAIEAEQRHRRVSERRDYVHNICHRGAVEFAHENTMEAFRAAFELGADGNEIDIRATKDGVLVCFHDDMLDHLLAAYGDVGDYSWDELQKFSFRNPEPHGKFCRIPTLREVFRFHRERAGLMHLDVKQPDLVKPISTMLDEFDMWDHIVVAPADFQDRRYKPTRAKASMYLDRSEFDAVAIASVLKKPGERIILEDPRGVALALGRRIVAPSKKPVRNEIAAWARETSIARSGDKRSTEELLNLLRNADDWKFVASGAEAEVAAADRIEQRSIAADELVRRGVRSKDLFAALEERVRNRSLHRSWRYCGLDGNAAMRALISLEAPQAVAVGRYCLWRDDPAVEAARNPKFKNPRSWTDWRTKVNVFSLLESIPGAETEQLCRDYLALSDKEARIIGVPQFEAAARTLLTISANASTVKELLGHRLSVIRGRAILFCLAHTREPWATDVLRDNAPHALKYIVYD